ncbi:hypothetical protein [Streptacidiphilus monticola]|uniref:Uncharacterized protein n=1 Tax=Streptacidiphilus monticola TaxID=2161674 RepID=A0ABW1FYQ1_9ACTN
MSEQQEPRAGRRVGRSYTRARRHPWVLGKIGEFTLPLGPYTPAQLAIAGVGTFALIKTYGWWAPLGPLPLIGLGALVWAARSAKVGGRTPQAALLGLLAAALQPPAGRINNATARDRRPTDIVGGFHLTTTGDAAAAQHPAHPRTPAAHAARTAARDPARLRNRAAQGARAAAHGVRAGHAGAPPAARTPPAAPTARPGPGEALTPLQRLLAEKAGSGS